MCPWLKDLSADIQQTSKSFMCEMRLEMLLRASRHQFGMTNAK